VVDLGALGFADPSLMIDLAMLARRLRRRGGIVRLREPQPAIAQLIDVVGLARLDGIRLEPASAGS
jgi:anti-anti-sigma regulatory factor